MLVFQLVLWFVFLSAYIGLRVLFGFRIYVSDTSFVTVREVMFPVLLLLFETSSQIIFGFSWMPWMVVVSAVVGLLLLYRKRHARRFMALAFVHQYLSIIFLLFEVGVLLLQVGRVL